ncbi:hypothetical protein J5X84_22360 [Streptosporangiaceae bacterium NEAU-GS5]|nr:hypothetical protein [Streptosporangiaceae bacterium NEAU-GS5]
MSGFEYEPLLDGIVGDALMWKKRAFVASAPPSDAELAESAAEDAWKALTLVVDLVKHAESKAGLTLASAGAIGGVAYSLIKSVTRPSMEFGVAAGLCGLFVVISALAAGMTVIPRASSEPTNLLYYHHIATRFGALSEPYVEKFNTLVARPDSLIPAIAHQVWANARVARKKYRWAGLALGALLGAVGTLALAAAIAVVENL